MSEYLALMEDAYDALHRLLEKTHPGKGIAVRAAYLSLEVSIDEHRERADPAEPVVDTREQRKWVRDLNVKERERAVLGILSERRLTNDELLCHIRETHPGLDVWHSNVVSVVSRLYKARELDRTGEPARNGRTKYRYFKRTDLDGPIADLERTFHAEEKGV